jgi:Transposase C of IS166 homeodomain
MTTADALPEDMPSLRAAALALIAERDELLRRVERMHHIIRQFQRAQYDRHSERLDHDQLQLILEERDIAAATAASVETRKTRRPRAEPSTAQIAAGALASDRGDHRAGDDILSLLRWRYACDRRGKIRAARHHCTGFSSPADRNTVAERAPAPSSRLPRRNA